MSRLISPIYFMGGKPSKKASRDEHMAKVSTQRRIEQSEKRSRNAAELLWKKLLKKGF